MNSETLKLYTQADAINAIRSVATIVASVDKEGNFSMSESPVAHKDMTSARVEAKRLAGLYPGKMFVILKLAGAELVPVNSISI